MASGSSPLEKLKVLGTPQNTRSIIGKHITLEIASPCPWRPPFQRAEPQCPRRKHENSMRTAWWIRTDGNEVPLAQPGRVHRAHRASHPCLLRMLIRRWWPAIVTVVGLWFVLLATVPPLPPSCDCGIQRPADVRPGRPWRYFSGPRPCVCGVGVATPPASRLVATTPPRAFRAGDGRKMTSVARVYAGDACGLLRPWGLLGVCQRKVFWLVEPGRTWGRGTCRGRCRLCSLLTTRCLLIAQMPT